MKSIYLVILLLLGSIVDTLGQCTVTKDGHGQVITTCQVNGMSAPDAPLHKQLTFLGSEFASFPIWQRGRIRFDQAGKELACELAYNVVSQQVLCRLAGDESPKPVVPYSFTLNGIKYLRQSKSVVGINYALYTTELTSGPTKLLKSLKGRFVKMPIRNGYDKEAAFAGSYEIDERYYLQKKEASPQLISLTKNALLSVLADYEDVIASTLPNRRLTVGEVIKAVHLYDSLTVSAQLSATSLATDASFPRHLLAQIKYPHQAWSAQVYARVYVGFEITGLGQLVNIQLLSPANVGYGFGQAVTEALGKWAPNKPEYAGKYVLPVSFTYTAGMNRGQKFIPVNTLSRELLGSRVVLSELVVNQLMAKDAANNREVWGYYK